MDNQIFSKTFLFLCFLVLATKFSEVKAQTCKPSGNTRAPRGVICDEETDCCLQGKLYPIYRCSPPVSNHTKATLTITSFENEGDDYPPYCDLKYHSDDELIAMISTGWYNKGSRCLKYINIYGNGRSVQAKVIGECDSTVGCDADHGYQPPCGNNIVTASKAVWKTLGVDETHWDQMDIYWNDA